MLNNSCLSSILFLLLIPFLGIGQNKTGWQIQPTTIQTRWAKDVNPENPLPEYPRPQMVRENWKNLNGLWDYSVIPKDAPMPSAYQGNILVPYPIESALSGVKMPLLPSENLWYRRTFRRPDFMGGERVLLHFGAVDWQAVVYVNGREIGEHTGGYTEFSFDITNTLKQGENELVVKVFDPTDKGVGPHGKQVLRPDNIYYTASSGIWQTVWMETVASTNVDRLILTPNVEYGRLTVGVITNGDTAGIKAIITAKAKGRTISTLSGPIGAVFSMKIPNVHLWSPEDPFLYDLEVTLVRNTKVVDKVKSYFGMRKIEIKKDDKGFDRIFLNGKYYYNLGTLDQGFWPEGLYTAPTDSALQFDLMAAKAMGFNTVRKHIKVEPSRWYFHADRLGLLIWQDMVNPNHSLPEGSKEAFEKESMEILTQLYNHPSITTWVLFNEKWGQYDQERLTKWIKNSDPSRLVNGHSGEYLYVNNVLRSPSPNAYVGADMTDVHSYPKPMISIKLPGKAQVVGEFGGIGAAMEGHIWDDLVTGWGYDGTVTPEIMEMQYSQMIDTLIKLEAEGLSGSIYTQPFDVESEQNGLITYDRYLSKIPIEDLRRLNFRVRSSQSPNEISRLDLGLKEGGEPMKTFSETMARYNIGARDSSTLRRLTICIQNKGGMEKKIDSLVAEYIANIKDSLNSDNIRFICRFTKSVDDPGFTIIRSNIDVVNRIVGRGEAERCLIGAITTTDIIPYLSNKPIDWDKLESTLNEKYGVIGQEAIWQAEVFYAANNGDWSVFKRNAREWYLMFGNKRVWIDGNITNSIAWRAFKNSTDTTILNTALLLIKKSLMLGESAYNLDTYANLLYKLGRKKEAIDVQAKAIALSPDNDRIKIAFEKMSRGEKTWE